MITIQKDSYDELPIVVIDMLGQEVFTGQMYSNIEQLDLSHLSPNVYLMRVGTEVKRISIVD